MKRLSVTFIAALGLCSSLTSLRAQPAPPYVLGVPDDTNLVEETPMFGQYVIADYFDVLYGVATYSINGLTFVNDGGLVGGNGFTGTVPSFSGTDSAALDAISAGTQYIPGGGTADFTVPSTAGHNYVLELLFHDSDFTTAGSRIFTVYAGPAGSATNVVYANFDMAGLGAGANVAQDVILRYVLTNATSSGIEVKLVPSVQNVSINGLLLLDMTGSPIPTPLIFVQPVNTSGFATFSASFDCLAAGPPGYAYQWQVSTVNNPPVWNNLANGGGVSGSATPTLTLNNLSLGQSGNLYQVVVSNQVVQNSSTMTVTSTPAILTVNANSGITGVNSPSGVNTSGNFLIAEYYGFDYGPLPVDGLTFYNNNARLGDGNGVATLNTPNFGSTTSDTNLALISGNDLYNTNGGFQIVLPTVSGRNYSLQLLFHDNFYSTVGSRVFDVNAGLRGQGVVPWVQNVDLVQLGAYETQPEDALLTTNFTSDGSAFEVDLTSVTQNPLICALTLQDLSATPVPPLINIEPEAATNIFVGRTFTLSTQVGGTPLVYQWQVYPLSGGATNNVSGGNVSGSTSNILTVTNATLAQAGNYQLDVGNSTPDEATSTVAAVTIYVTNTITPGNNYPYAILASNAVDYWQLNEPNSTPIVFDNGRDANDGVAGANLSLGAAGPSGAGFPGFAANNACLQSTANTMDDYVTTPPLGFTATNLTMLVWLNPSAAQSSAAGIMLSRQGASGTFCSGLAYGTTLQSFGDYSVRYFWNGYSADSLLQVPQNIWSLVALVITPTNTSIFVLNTNSISSWIVPSNNAACPFSNPFLIGGDTADGGNGARTYTGSLDEPAVFTNALTFSQILNLYNIALGITEAAPTVSAPTSRTIVFPGTPVSLSCTVAGTPTPTLQWQMRPVGLTGPYTPVTNGINGISGAGLNTLGISSANANNVGDYILIAKNNLGGVTSSVARVLVIETANTHALIGEWITGNSQSLNDVSGYSSSPANHQGVVENGSSPSWTTGPFAGSSALMLNGYAVAITNSAITDNDYRLDYDHNITNRFSIAFWAQGFPASNDPFVSKDGQNSTSGWQVEFDSNDKVNQATLEIPGINSAQQQNDGSGIAVTDNNWHHYCGTYDAVSGQCHFYLDGVQVDYFDNDYPYVSVATAEHVVLGAREQPALGEFFTGNLFDVRLYNYAVQAPEVQAMISPPSANAIGIYLGSTNSVVVGRTVGFAVIIPTGANASGPVTVTVTDNSPAVARIEGEANPFQVTFPQGGPSVQYFTLLALAPGTISFTATASGLTAGTLADEPVTPTVIAPALIGHWITGGQTLADQSGYLPSGTQDGLASSGATLGGATAVYQNTNLPPPWASQENGTVYALNLLSGSYAVAIEGTTLTDTAHTYNPTYDWDINNGFSFAFWALGWPPAGNGGFSNPWISKNGGNNNIPGYDMRVNGSVVAPDFSVRYAAGAQNNSDTVDMWNSIICTNLMYANGANPNTTWHHYACVWDGISGFRKLYIDGVLAATVNNDYGPVPAPIYSALVLGGNDAADVDSTGNANVPTAPNIGSFFTGHMFDVRFYNYPLAFSEVESIYQPFSSALIVAADTPVIDGLGEQGTVGISLPLNAGAGPYTIEVTNSNMSAVGISTNGVAVTTSNFSLTLPLNGYSSARLTLTGLGQGQATITAAGGGFTSASATVNVYGPQLVGRWFIGSSNLTEVSGFRPAGTHDAVAVSASQQSGSTPAEGTLISPTFLGGYTFSGGNWLNNGNVPPGFPGASVTWGGGAGGLVVKNSDAVVGNEVVSNSALVSILDPSYQPTFDDLLAYHFTCAFWEKSSASSGSFAPFVSKCGENNMGWSLRRQSSGNSNVFTMHYSGSHVPALISPTNTLLFGITGWTHVAVVFDGLNGYRAVYTNGVPMVVQTNEFGSWSQARNHHLCFFTEEQPSDNANFTTFADWIPVADDNSQVNGSLYDMRVYNYAMNQTQIQSLLTYTEPGIGVASSGTQIQIDWSSLYPYPAFQLYETTSLREPITWTPSGLAATLENGEYIATDTAGAAEKFYVLKFVPQ